jgi:hypothetical protein
MNRRKITLRELAMHVSLAFGRRGLTIAHPQIIDGEGNGTWRILPVSGEGYARHHEIAGAVEAELGMLYALAEFPSRVVRPPLNHRGAR